MYTTIGQFDYTNQIAPGQIEAEFLISDPMPTLKFEVEDVGCTINILEGMEVIIWDETLTDLVSNIPMIPAVNMLRGSDIGGNISLWTLTGTLSAILLAPGNFQASMTFSNNIVGQAYYYQQTLAGDVLPGQSYCYSYWVQIPGVMTNCSAFFALQYQDSAGNVISTTFDTVTSTPGNALQRRSLTVTAPANAYYIVAQWGGQTSNATNSGSIIWGPQTSARQVFQLEPRMFASTQGVSYPSPDLGFFIVGSGVRMPDGTESRRCRLFTGWIDHLEAHYEDSGNNRIWQVECTHATAVLENTNLLDQNISTPTYDKAIIDGIVTASYAGILSTGSRFNTDAASQTVQGALINNASYADQTFREILNAMVDASGYMFYCDNYYYVHYNPLFYDIAAITITDTSPDYVSSFPLQEYYVERDLTTVKNRVKVVGALLEQPAITELFSGNGSNKVFNFTFVPNNITACSVGGTAKKGGASGVNTFAQGYDYLYDKGGQTFTFNAAPASASNNVSITYTYSNPVSAQVESLASFAQYGRWYDSKVNDSTITSVQQGINRGIAELTKFAFAQIILHGKLNVFILPGQVVWVTSSHDGITKQPYVNTHVIARYLGNGVNEYEYELGTYRPTMLDTMRNTSKANNRARTVAAGLAPAQIDIVTSDPNYAYSDSMTVAAGVAVTAKYGTAVYGYSSFV